MGDGFIRCWKNSGRAIAPADKERVKKIREQMPSLKHRKKFIFKLMSKFLNKKLFRYLFVFTLLNLRFFQQNLLVLLPLGLKTNGNLELRTKSNTNLKAYFQKLTECMAIDSGLIFPEN